MKRYTLDELRELAERCRVNEADVVLDPITVRSLVDATEALIAWGDHVVRCSQAGDPQIVSDEIAVAVEVARARFVDEWDAPPGYDPAMHERARQLARRESERDELDDALAELDAVSPRVGGWVRRLFGRGS